MNYQIETSTISANMVNVGDIVRIQELFSGFAFRAVVKLERDEKITTIFFNDPEFEFDPKNISILDQIKLENNQKIEAFDQPKN